MANQIEYICSYCGAKKILNKASGRPVPGNCPRKPKGLDGKMRPHSWVVNRRIG